MNVAWVEWGLTIGAGLWILLLLRRRTSSDLAAIASIRGEVGDAHSLLLERLTRNPRDAKALFTLSSVCLQEGDLEGARDAARRFTQVAPSAPEAPVLLALIEERARPRPGAWLDSFIAALHCAGGCSAPTVFPDGLRAQKAIAPDAMEALEPSERLLVECSMTHGPPGASLVGRALELSRRDDLSLPVGLAAFSVLSAVGDRASAAARLIHLLARQNPETAYLGLVALLEGTSRDAPFSSDEIERLTKEIADDALSPMVRLNDIYEAFKSANTKVDPGNAHQVAFEASIGAYLATIPSTMLSRRSMATNRFGTSLQRAELATGLTRLSRRLLASRYLIELGLGSALLTRAAELSGDAAAAVEATAVSSSFNELSRRTTALLKFVGQWPIAPLAREFTDRVIDGELALFDELTKALSQGSSGPTA